MIDRRTFLSGVAASLARPGGNVTGLTYAEPDRFKKQLELLKAVAAFREFPQAGLLMSYGADLADINRRAMAPNRVPAHSYVRWTCISVRGSIFANYPRTRTRQCSGRG